MSMFGECFEKRSFAPAAMQQSTTARSCPRFSRRGSLQVMTWLFSGLVLVRVGKYLHVSSQCLSLSSNMAGGANQRFVLRESGKTVSLRPLATMRRVTSCHISQFSDLKVPLFPGLFQVTWRWRSVMSIRSTRKAREVSHARRRWGLGRITGSFLCAHYPMCWVFSRCFFNFCQTQRECWNSSTCGSRRLVVPCSSTTKFCCDKTSSWHCPNGRHSYEVKLCLGGSPTECPGCQDDRLSAEMQDIQTALEQDSALNSNLHECFLETKSVLGFSRTACFAEDFGAVQVVFSFYCSNL